ncbi:Aste57867_20976 [Aphanomyces stellatus]|uniref:Aste57867_20976 protein n=1 Tax=Aphanomyces stellatus TaxID=120398 RepID=A0A485LGA5_9STRA|nr:hypothetical protein As57867_020908 [Aphanomyces stellatus]VFT97652.1 Aste57867_20976 [Aphanomyces stellatus]
MIAALVGVVIVAVIVGADRKRRRGNADHATAVASILAVVASDLPVVEVAPQDQSILYSRWGHRNRNTPNGFFPTLNVSTVLTFQQSQNMVCPLILFPLAALLLVPGTDGQSAVVPMCGTMSYDLGTQGCCSGQVFALFRRVSSGNGDVMWPQRCCHTVRGLSYVAPQCAPPSWQRRPSDDTFPRVFPPASRVEGGDSPVPPFRPPSAAAMRWFNLTWSNPVPVQVVVVPPVFISLVANKTSANATTATEATARPTPSSLRTAAVPTPTMTTVAPTTSPPTTTAPTTTPPTTATPDSHMKSAPKSPVMPFPTSAADGGTARWEYFVCLVLTLVVLQ